MKSIALLLGTVLFSVVSVYAEDTAKSTAMSGWLCNSQCVTQDAGRASCDQNCAQKSGDAVLVNDQGQVFKITSQEKVASHAGKKAKIKCHPVKDLKDTMNADSLYLGG